MMDLRNIILEKKDHLPKQTGKLVNRLYNKIKLDSYYPPKIRKQSQWQSQLQ